ncbi:hypothetical protein J437_LFUL007956 [Ladona fulva]|uniref:Uncharacterized protein n=1 Tax=Ladona fulva TaxID=123851 RepID=A0A8K0KD60_LADFU|nr:hypothetical protein J437_LFUL007956 [Ladona fulva]
MSGQKWANTLELMMEMQSTSDAGSRPPGNHSTPPSEGAVSSSSVDGEQASADDTVAVRPRPPLKTQISTVWSRKQNAVSVRRACKMYGPKKNRNAVLDQLNMTVPKGTM